MKLAYVILALLAFIWLAWSSATPAIDRIKVRKVEGAEILKSAGLSIDL